jgi:TRAP-type C4-dicarboxylate transport system substrate-binding protein
MRPLTRREFNRLASLFGFSATLGAAELALGAGQVPTAARVAAGARQLRIAEAKQQRKAEYTIRFAPSVITTKTEEVQFIGAWEFKRQLEELSDGRIAVRIFDGGAICTEQTCAEKVMTGIVDLGANSTANASIAVPFFNCLDFAYMFPTRASIVHFFYHPASERLFRAITRETYGLEVLWTQAEMRSLMMGLRYKESPAIRTPEGVKGAKVRATNSDLIRIALTLFGTNPIPLDWSETLEGLKTGVVDAAETWPTAAAGFGMAAVLSQHIDIEFCPGIAVSFMNRRKFERLPADVQELIREAGFRTQQWSQKNLQRSLTDITGLTEPPQEGTIYARYGVKVNLLSEDEKQPWIERASPEFQPKPWESWRERLAKIGQGFDFYQEISQIAHEIPKDTDPLSIQPRRWWKEA